MAPSGHTFELLRAAIRIVALIQQTCRRKTFSHIPRKREANIADFSLSVGFRGAEGANAGSIDPILWKMFLRNSS